MDKPLKLGPAFTGVTIGQQPRANLDIGPRYYRAVLEVDVKLGSSATSAALSEVIGNILVKQNDKLIREHLASELDRIQTVYGSQYAAVCRKIASIGGAVSYATITAGSYIRWTIPILFAEPWRDSYAARAFGALYTSWSGTDSTGKGAVSSKLSSMSFEFVLCPTTTNIDTATAPAARLWIEYSNEVGPYANGNPLNVGTAWIRSIVPYTGAGKRQIDDLPLEGVLQQISLLTSTDTILDVSVERDQFPILTDYTAGANVQQLVFWNMNSTQLVADTTAFHVVFDRADNPADSLSLAKSSSFRITANMSGASASSPNITMVRQVYKNL